MGGGFSVELCGGTHVRRTGDIGVVRLTSESGIAAGVRRIEAVAGAAALSYIRGIEADLDEAARAVKSSRKDVLSKIRSLVDQQRELSRELEQVKAKLAANQGVELVDRVKTVKA